MDGAISRIWIVVPAFFMEGSKRGPADPLHPMQRDKSLPLELANQDLLSCLDDHPRYWKGTICAGWSIAARPSQSAGTGPADDDMPHALGLVRQGDLPMVGIDLHRDYSWFRLEQVLPAESLVAGPYRLRLSYLSDGADKDRLPQVKIIEYNQAGGHTFARIARNLPASGTPRHLDVEFDIAANALADRQYRLCIELGQPGRFCFGGLSLIRDQDGLDLNGQHVPPYRAYHFPVSKDLKDLNDGMDSDLRHGPLDWVVRMLGVALRLEDYETAGGLARYLVAHHGADAEAMGKAGPRILDTLLATGDLDGARGFLIDMAALGVRHDRLAQAGRILGGTRTGGGPVSYALPSGKLDVFGLNRDTEYNRVAFDDMLSQPFSSDTGQILWANYLRHASEADYLARLNGYLAAHGSPFSMRLDDAPSDNILNRASFRQDRPLSGLLSGGPLVSVIVAAWNAESTVDYAMRSILGQTYRNVEILVADDASTDGTRDRLRAFAGDPRVRLFGGERNQGAYNIRNRLIGQARGELITFHDADDVALPHRIAAQVTAMTEKGARVSLASWLRIKPQGHLVAFRDNQFLRMCLNSIMFTRPVFDGFGPYRPVLCGADSEFYELLRGRLPARDIVSVAQPLVLGLWGDGSLTRTAGIEADEIGYRAPARRAYAGLAGRQRILGRLIVPDALLDRTAREGAIARTPSDLVSLNG